MKISTEALLIAKSQFELEQARKYAFGVMQWIKYGAIPKEHINKNDLSDLIYKLNTAALALDESIEIMNKQYLVDE